MAVGLVAGVGYSVVSGSQLARAYLSALGPQLHEVGLAAAGFGVATALISPLAFPMVRAWAKRVVQWRMPLMGLSGKTLRVPVVSGILEGLTVLVPVAVLVGFAIRPSFQVTRGATDPYAIRFVASLQRLAGLPVDGRQQYYEQSLNWVIWYVGLPAVLLACLGAALLGRRCLRALLRWQGAAPAAQFWALPLLVFGWSTVAVLWDPATFPDQPWASRRLVPVVLPGLICLALWMCSRVRLRAAELGAAQVSIALVAACALLALAIPAAVTTFDPGYVGISATATSVSSAPSSSPSASASASPGPGDGPQGHLHRRGARGGHLVLRHQPVRERDHRRLRHRGPHAGRPRHVRHADRPHGRRARVRRAAGHHRHRASRPAARPARQHSRLSRAGRGRAPADREPEDHAGRRGPHRPARNPLARDLHRVAGHPGGGVIDLP
jgi:hypothetical protein